MFRLLRHYTVTSAGAILAVTALIAVLIHRSSESTLVLLTEQSNLNMARIIINGSKGRIFEYLDFASKTSPAALRVSAEAKALRTAIHSSVQGIDILKVKLYLLNGFTAFSSNLDEIGLDKSAYGGFQQVLDTNKAVSQLTFRGKFSGFEKIVVDRSLIASYVPVRGRDGGVAAVLELYTDVSDLAESLKASDIRSVLAIGGVAGGLWLVLLGIVARGDRILRIQYTNLESEVEERNRVHEELRQLAGTDPLTGISNRRQFTELADQELRHSNRYGHALSALMIDLDGFKVINDTYGHAAGDHALTAAAQAIHASLRATDILGRLGGDEFAVVLVEADIAMAEYVAGRIRAAISGLVLSFDGEDVFLHASVGGAHAQAGESLEHLIARADDALYEAKRAGRDTVMFDQRDTPDKLDF